MNQARASAPKSKQRKTRQITITKSNLLWILNKHYITCKVIGITNNLHSYKLNIIDITREELEEKLSGLKKWQ